MADRIKEEKTPIEMSVGMLLDLWAEKELQPGTLSNGTLCAYLAVIRRIKKHPLASVCVTGVSVKQLQSCLNDFSLGACCGGVGRPVSRGYMLQYMAVLNGAFHYAVHSRALIAENPMEAVRLRLCADSFDPVSGMVTHGVRQQILSHAQYRALIHAIGARDEAFLLPVQIAYYTGLRIGEVCALTRQDVSLEGRYLIVCRSMRYNSIRHRMELGAAKRGRSRFVEFGETLAAILQKALMPKMSSRTKHPAPKKKNAVRTVMEGDRTYHELYSLDHDAPLPEDYHEMQFLCLKANGAYLRPNTVAQICSKAAGEVDGLHHFHFHMLRHTYASNLINKGALVTDVSELLGHRDVHTTLSIYTHALQGTRRACVQLLDQLEDG